LPEKSGRIEPAKHGDVVIFGEIGHQQIGAALCPEEPDIVAQTLGRDALVKTGLGGVDRLGLARLDHLAQVLCDPAAEIFVGLGRAIGKHAGQPGLVLARHQGGHVQGGVGRGTAVIGHQEILDCHRFLVDRLVCKPLRRRLPSIPHQAGRAQLRSAAPGCRA